MTTDYKSGYRVEVIFRKRPYEEYPPQYSISMDGEAVPSGDFLIVFCDNRDRLVYPLSEIEKFTMKRTDIAETI